MDIEGQGAQRIAAIVTGGASGLGAATARMLAKAGAKVAVLDVNKKAAGEVAGEIDGIAIDCDVTDAAATEKAIAKAAADHGPARIVINCAGVGPAKRIVGRDGPMPLEEFSKRRRDQSDRHVQCDAACCGRKCRTSNRCRTASAASLSARPPSPPMTARSAKPLMPPRRAAW